MLKKLIKKWRVEKFIAGLMICAILTPVFATFMAPRQVEAQYVDPFNAGAWIKDLINQTFKQIKMHVGRILLNRLNQSVTKWIASGFHGNPFYLENSKSFFKDIVKYEVKNIVDTYAYNRDKFPFGRSFALNTISAYQRNLEDNTAYTLSRVINDPVFLENYRNDFNVGGWDGFFINTQYPQNNYIGFQMLATEELARKLDGTAQTAAQKVNTILEQSGGFLAPQVCADPGTKYNNGKNEFLQPRFDMAKFERDNPYNCDSSDSLGFAICNDQWNAKLEKEKADWAKDNTCKNLVTTTPGSVVANQIETTLQSKIRQTELAAAMGNALATGFGLLLDSLLQKGLTKLGGVLDSTAGTDTVNLRPNAVGGSGVNVETCQSVGSSIATGNASGYTQEGEYLNLDIELNNSGASESCTSVSVPGGTPPDLSEFNRYPIPGGGSVDNPPPAGGCGGGDNEHCTCKANNDLDGLGLGIFSKYRAAVVAARDAVHANPSPAVGLDANGNFLGYSYGDTYAKAIVCELRKAGYLADGVNDEIGVARTGDTFQENFDVYSSIGLVNVRFMAFCTSLNGDGAYPEFSTSGRGFTCQ